jgi:hypothetical protein
MVVLRTVLERGWDTSVHRWPDMMSDFLDDARRRRGWIGSRTPDGLECMILANTRGSARDELLARSREIRATLH